MIASSWEKSFSATNHSAPCHKNLSRTLPLACEGCWQYFQQTSSTHTHTHLYTHTHTHTQCAHTHTHMHIDRWGKLTPSRSNSRWHTHTHTQCAHAHTCISIAGETDTIKKQLEMESAISFRNDYMHKKMISNSSQCHKHSVTTGKALQESRQNPLRVPCRPSSRKPSEKPSEGAIFWGYVLFYLRLGLFYLRLVFAAHGKLAWSLLLSIEIRFGLFNVLLTVENRLVFLVLTVPPIRKLGLVFFAYASHTISKKDKP